MRVSSTTVKNCTAATTFRPNKTLLKFNHINTWIFQGVLICPLPLPIVCRAEKKAEFFKWLCDLQKRVNEGTLRMLRNISFEITQTKKDNNPRQARFSRLTLDVRQVKAKRNQGRKVRYPVIDFFSDVYKACGDDE